MVWGHPTEILPLLLPAAIQKFEDNDISATIFTGSSNSSLCYLTLILSTIHFLKFSVDNFFKEAG